MRKQLFISVTVLFNLINTSSAQITFQKTYGGANQDNLFSMYATSDSGFILTGQTQSYGAGYLDIYLIKTDKYGDTLWTRTFGDSLAERGTSVIQTSDGGYIVAGFKQKIAGSTSDFCVIKTDANGNPMWQKVYGGPDDDQANAIKQTSDGGYIITGYTSSFGMGDYDLYLAKIDSIGNQQWSKAYGDASFDYAEDVLQTSDGGYIITGGYIEPVVPFEGDVLLVKTDSAGNLLWTKAYGGAEFDIAEYVRETPDQGYIIAARTFSFGVGDRDIYLIKTDSTGNLLWSKTYGGLYYDGGWSVELIADSGYFVAGFVQYSNALLSKAVLLKTDLSGNLLWAKSYSDSSNSGAIIVQITVDQGIGIAFASTVNGISSGHDIWLTKIDQNGSFSCEDTITLIEGISPTVVTSPVLIMSQGGGFNVQVLAQGNGAVVSTHCTNVGIDEITGTDMINIFPNPASGSLMISTGVIIKRGNVQIFNTLSEVVFAKDIVNEVSIEINLKNVSNGIFFVKVLDGEKSYCKKLIIEQD